LPAPSSFADFCYSQSLSRTQTIFNPHQYVPSKPLAIVFEPSRLYGILEGG